MLKDKTVVITGASSGIGEATSRKLYDAGANVVLGARRADRLENLKDKLGEKSRAFVVDVADPDQVKKMMTYTVEEFGRIDVLINNAGVGHLGPMAETPLAEWLNMVDVNVKGLLSCIHAALPQLRENKGHIINLASVAAHDVFPEAVVYCATKHAVNAITVGFRKEFRDQVKITNISPGAVDTEFSDHTHHQEKRQSFVKVFEGVVLTSEDIANAIHQVLTAPEHLVINEMIIRPNK